MQLGFTQKEMSEKLGIKQPTYNHYESDKSLPKGERKRIIEEFLAS